MAFETDCGLSTVLATLPMARTAGQSIPEERGASAATHLRRNFARWGVPERAARLEHPNSPERQCP